MFVSNKILYLLSMKNVFFEGKKKCKKEKSVTLLGNGKIKCFSMS